MQEKKVTKKEKKVQPLDETTDKLVIPPGMEMSISSLNRNDQADADEQLLDSDEVVEIKMTADQSCAPLRAKMLVNVQVKEDTTQIMSIREVLHTGEDHKDCAVDITEPTPLSPHSDRRLIQEIENELGKVDETKKDEEPDFEFGLNSNKGKFGRLKRAIFFQISNE